MDIGDKVDIVNNENIVDELDKIVKSINNNLLTIARNKLCDSISKPINIGEMKQNLKNKKMCLIGWCEKLECENNIKEITGAKSLCKLLGKKYHLDPQNTKCVCNNPSEATCLFGKSY
jgi:prolyl-tRNA synthetase